MAFILIGMALLVACLLLFAIGVKTADVRVAVAATCAFVVGMTLFVVGLAHQDTLECPAGWSVIKIGGQYRCMDNDEFPNLSGVL